VRFARATLDAPPGRNLQGHSANSDVREAVPDWLVLDFLLLIGVGHSCLFPPPRLTASTRVMIARWLTSASR
jgi:hypothetical protein